MTGPMYRRIADDLRRKIEAGELGPGAQLKTEAELGDEYGDEYGQDGKVSRNTVRDAIKLLVNSGLVETRPGQGTFVVRKVKPFVSRLTTDPEAGGVEDKVYRSEVERRGRTPQETVPRVEVQSASALVASHLGIAEGTMVISRYQQRFIDGTPWSLQTTFYPMEFVTRGSPELLVAKNIEDGVVKYLEATLGVRQVGWRDTIIGRPADMIERAFFSLSDKVQVAIFDFRRTSFDEHGKPIRFTVTVYPADRNQFEMEAGRVPPPPEPPSPSASAPASTGASANGGKGPSGSSSRDLS
jgi:GntR family transcriptional regulator